MNKIKVLVSVVALLMVCFMCSCSAVTELAEEIESQMNVIEEEINNDISLDDYEFNYDDYEEDYDSDVELYSLPAALYDWDDEYVATFGEVEGYDYDPEYSDETFIVYDCQEYGVGADTIYITADKAEYMDGTPYEYYREEFDSFSEYVADDEDYGKFTIGSEKTVIVGDKEVSYFEVYYPAYSSHFYETAAWTYVKEANAYVGVSIESCVSDEGVIYDSEQVIKAVFSAMVIDKEGALTVETEAVEETVEDDSVVSDEPVGEDTTTSNEPESVEKDIIDAFR